MTDPDLQIRRGGGDHPDPEIRGSGGQSQNIFWPFGPQFGIKISGGGGGGGGGGEAQGGTSDWPCHVGNCFNQTKEPPRYG